MRSLYLGAAVFLLMTNEASAEGAGMETVKSTFVARVEDGRCFLPKSGPELHIPYQYLDGGLRDVDPNVCHSDDQFPNIGGGIPPFAFWMPSGQPPKEDPVKLIGVTPAETGRDLAREYFVRIRQSNWSYSSNSPFELYLPRLLGQFADNASGEELRFDPVLKMRFRGDPKREIQHYYTHDTDAILGVVGCQDTWPTCGVDAYFTDKKIYLKFNLVSKRVSEWRIVAKMAASLIQTWKKQQ